MEKKKRHSLLIPLLFVILLFTGTYLAKKLSGSSQDIFFGFVLGVAFMSLIFSVKNNS